LAERPLSASGLGGLRNERDDPDSDRAETKNPTGKRQPVLPEGGRAKQAQVKEMITLPEGNKPRQPNLKENIQLPEQSGHEVFNWRHIGAC
jgi:hypothetical protein